MDDGGEAGNGLKGTAVAGSTNPSLAVALLNIPGTTFEIVWALQQQQILPKESKVYNIIVYIYDCYCI